jgi:hypothetical protein
MDGAARHANVWVHAVTGEFMPDAVSGSDRGLGVKAGTLVQGMRGETDPSILRNERRFVYDGGGTGDSYRNSC